MRKVIFSLTFEKIYLQPKSYLQGLSKNFPLEEKINCELGAEIASIAPDTVILVGETLVGSVKKGYLDAGGEEGKLFSVSTLDGAKPLLAERIGAGDAVLFLNDLPDVY